MAASNWRWAASDLRLALVAVVLALLNTAAAEAAKRLALAVASAEGGLLETDVSKREAAVLDLSARSARAEAAALKVDADFACATRAASSLDEALILFPDSAVATILDALSSGVAAAAVRGVPRRRDR